MKEPIIILNLYLENEQKAKVKIGVLKGDGLLISTPMGSYCKSLNLNGPLMSKTMENIMITPICPLSMKFRPICLPASSRIFIEIDPHCRTDHA
jgi:NAD kinase